jgi:hypothetical protein
MGKDQFNVSFSLDYVPNHMFGAWLYAPTKEFPHANTKELPREIAQMNFGRVGFVASVDSKMLGDVLKVADRLYEVTEVDVVDFVDHFLKGKKLQEGFLLCQPHSSQSSDSDQSKKE